ncbi:MAG: DUF2264 domain-containing protein [Verrucomicrobiota bacterium]|nr:DUF2264 domain-containing protein [Verrucomicrobiota bacterium]
MKRREFIYLNAATAFGLAVDSLFAASGASPAKSNSRKTIDSYFLEILDGFLRNARKTSDSFAVCDFPQGTLLKSCCTPSGKTYVSVARMMPALTAWIVAKKQPGVFRVGHESFNLTDVLLAAFKNAFDPTHPDYWGEAPADKASQRAVEASLVAWSLWQLGDDFLEKLSSRERANIQKWLASCTQVPERENNHAWFSAINQATRIALSKKWKEFSGSEEWMLADLKAMEALAKSAEDGWYSDSPTASVYDYYNFWTFASHFLYWNRIIGKSNPDLSARFRERLKRFLEKTPCFFAANGSHVLFGRSLIYRWPVLMPMVEAYAQGMWTHSPGLLRTIVRRNLEFHWNIGAFDKTNGKLRETFTAQGSAAIREPYIDNGHPYWCMQAFSLYSIPPQDAFWTSREECLPVERSDFSVRLEKAQMLLVGTKSSGQVRLFEARNEPRRPRYRDAYQRFSYSSHFPFNYVVKEDRMTWDQALVFRNCETGFSAGRSGIKSGTLTAKGIETEWWAELGDLRFDVVTRISVNGEFEKRTHNITAPMAALNNSMEILEGSSALGLMNDEIGGVLIKPKLQILRSPRSKFLIASWNLGGFEQLEATESFDKSLPPNVNLIYPRMVVNTLRARFITERTTLISLHYASSRPLKINQLIRRASHLVAA